MIHKRVRASEVVEQLDELHAKATALPDRSRPDWADDPEVRELNGVASKLVRRLRKAKKRYVR